MASELHAQYGALKARVSGLPLDDRAPHCLARGTWGADSRYAGA